MTLEQIKQAIEDRIKELEPRVLAYNKTNPVMHYGTDPDGRKYHVARRATQEELELTELEGVLRHLNPARDTWQAEQT